MSEDPRIEEFTARINEAEANIEPLRKNGHSDFADKLQDNVNRMKQQRKEIIAGRV